ncbi:MAG: VWA domain-containing protein [Planctomycetota bacterium]
MDAQFNQLDALAWLWVLPVIIGACIWHSQRLERRRRRFADDRLHDVIMPDRAPARRWGRYVLWWIALMSLVAAAIDPRWDSEYEELPQRGIDVMVILDTSRSMLAEDCTPTRLERAQLQIGDLVRQLRGDRVGLITCAGYPTLRCPLTTDYGAFLLTVNEAEPELETRGGSMLGDAIRLARDAFTDDERDHKALVVFSDGEDQGSYPVEAARSLYEEFGIRIFTIGLGDDGDGARIPVGMSGQRYLMYDGQEVWTRMQADELRSIALASDGAFVPAGTRIVPMESVYAETIAPMAGRDMEAARIRRYGVRYQWFVALALFCIAAESMLVERRRRSSIAAARWSRTEALA